MKAYRFYSDPNRPVGDGRTGLRLFKFDEKGEYVTLDPILAKRLEAKFKCEEIELVEVGKQTEPEPAQEPIKVYKCKQCDYETANKGELLAHYREHKKEA